ncbi:MAG: hypothetical protein NUV54_02685 [Candidatus Taylorbacteria bacterium]|nr:hypothetical protein [Candidatus Taylorbacteria bacterium]
MISYDDFKKVEITVGEILSAEKIPDTDKLIKLSVDFGMRKNPSVHQNAPLPLEKGESEKMQERDIRQIVSGISLYFPDPQVLVGKRCMFVTNLEPRMIKGFESNGMLFAVSTDEGKFSLLEAQNDIPAGTRAK